MTKKANQKKGHVKKNDMIKIFLKVENGEQKCIVSAKNMFEEFYLYILSVHAEEVRSYFSS